MQIKNEENENKIILGGFNCTMDKMEMGDRNKKMYRCRFSYVLSKLIVDNGLKDLQKRADLLPQHLGYPESIVIYKVQAISRLISHVMTSFRDDYNDFFIDKLRSKTKIGKGSQYFNNSLLYKNDFSLTTKTFFTKNIKQNRSSLSDWWENTKSSFKGDGITFSKNSAKYQNFNTETKAAKITQKIKPQTRN